MSFVFDLHLSAFISGYRSGVFHQGLEIPTSAAPQTDGSVHRGDSQVGTTVPDGAVDMLARELAVYR